MLQLKTNNYVRAIWSYCLRISNSIYRRFLGLGNYQQNQGDVKVTNPIEVGTSIHFFLYCFTVSGCNDFMVYASKELCCPTIECAFKLNNNQTITVMENVRQAQRQLLELSKELQSDVHKTETLSLLKTLILQLALSGSLDEEKFKEAFNMTLAASVGLSRDKDDTFMNFLYKMYIIRELYLLPSEDMDIEGAIAEIKLLKDTVHDMNFLQKGRNKECILYEARLATFLECGPCTKTEKAILVDVMLMCAGEASDRDNSGTLNFIVEEIRRIKKAYKLC